MCSFLNLTTRNSTDLEITKNKREFASKCMRVLHSDNVCE